MFPSRSQLTLTLAATIIAAGCSSDTESGTASTTPACVYNQAYQENYAVDTIDAIQTNATDCYVLIDGLDATATDAIPAIKANGNQVGCYTSVGTGEVWREDFVVLEPFLVTEQWFEWEGEYFISDTAGALEVLKNRMALLGNAGCDWVEFDNMDWATSEETRTSYGIAATEEDAANFSNELCEHIHSLDMLCMAKNLALVPNHFDGVTFESYHDELDWWNPAHMQVFLDAGLPVFIFHYDEPDCSSARGAYTTTYGAGISVLCENPDLGGYLHDQ